MATIWAAGSGSVSQAAGPAPDPYERKLSSVERVAGVCVRVYVCGCCTSVVRTKVCNGFFIICSDDCATWAQRGSNKSCHQMKNNSSFATTPPPSFRPDNWSILPFSWCCCCSCLIQRQVSNFHAGWRIFVYIFIGTTSKTSLCFVLPSV